VERGHGGLSDLLSHLSGHLGLDPPGNVAPGVLPQVVLAVKALVALRTDVSLLARVNHKVQRELLLPLEGLVADGADEGSLGVVALLVPREMVLTLEAGAANVADEAPLQFVADEVLLEQLLLSVRHVALGTAEERRAVQGGRQTDFAGLRPLLLFLWRPLLFLLFGLQFKVL